MKKDLQSIKAGIDEVGFFQSIAELIQRAKHSVEKQVNTAMVITYFEIGRRIIEKEQLGAKRAQYGKKILQGLSDYLTAKLGKGWSIDNLKLMRRFYVVYSKPQIRQSLFSESDSQVVPIGETVFPQFNPKITWSHYMVLMRMDGAIFNLKNVTN